MKHLHFTQSLEPLNGGGLGSSSLALHQRMRALGIESSLCATRGGRPQHPVPGCHEFRRILPHALYYAPALEWHAGRLVREADVVHAHGMYVGTNLVFGRRAHRHRKPLVYHVHGMFEPYILSRSRWKKGLVHWLFEDANFKRVRLWRALTAREAEQIRGVGIRAPVVVVPNGLDLPVLLPAAAASEPIPTPWVPDLMKRCRRLLFLGRLHPKKGVDLLLEAWSRLGRSALDWELVVAGPDEGGHLAELRRQVDRLGLLGRVTFTGAVAGRAKDSLLRSADLFVLPSRSEGFPMAILEALAHQVPVVATRACNFPGLESALAGWECEPEAGSIEGVLRHALRCPDAEFLERGRAGRRLVENNYAWTSIIHRLTQACDAHCRGE